MILFFNTFRGNKEPQQSFKRNQTNEYIIPNCFSNMGFKTIPSEEELRKRYKELAKKYHPDRNTGDEEKFINLNKNYKEGLAYLEEN